MEWVLAARWGSYTLEQFEELPGERQALVVAAFRAERTIEAVVSYTQAKEMERKAK